MNRDKENREFIKGFKKITLSKVCKKNNISISNISNGVASKEKTEIIRREIEREIAKLYL